MVDQFATEQPEAGLALKYLVNVPVCDIGRCINDRPRGFPPDVPLAREIMICLASLARCRPPLLLLKIKFSVMQFRDTTGS